MKRIAAVSLALLALALGPATSLADDIVLVDYDGLPPNPSKLQDGIDAVSDGGTVYVMATLSTGPEQLLFRGPRNRGLDFGGKNITLTTIGGGAEKFAIDCQGEDRAFSLSTGTDTTSQIIGFTILNGATVDGGGAVRCEGGSPRIAECVFLDNAADFGGAISLTQGPARITDCEFYGNAATDGGGAVHAVDSQLTVRACTFGDNAADAGGGIWLGGSDLTLKLCTLSNNEGNLGSSVLLDSSTATIEQCILAFGRLGRPVYGGSPETFHCCVFGNADGDDLPGNAHDNLFVEPLLCDAYAASAGALGLCSNSPCLPGGGNPWGLQIGSRVQGCLECDSPVQDSSWGSIKALFR
jgi:hypothetical protein